MNISPISQNKQNFQHLGKSHGENSYSKKERAVITVETFAKFGKKFGKLAQAASAIAGIFTGVYVANILMNKLGNLLFRNKNERGVKATDFSAHVDDMVVAASYISDNKYVHSIARIVPLALMIPGYEVGTKKVH